MLKPEAPNSTKRRIILYNQRFTKVWGIMLSPLPLEIAFQIKLRTLPEKKGLYVLLLV